MTLRQEQIINILKNYIDSEGSATISIHDLGFPITPDSINPAMAELQALQDDGQITSFERVSSRVVKIILPLQ